MTENASSPLLWEELVTSGHVRAARLRRIQPWIIALGIILIWAGVLVIHLGPNVQPATSVAARVQQRLMQTQERVAAAFTKLTSTPARPDNLDRLPPISEIPEVVQTLLKKLESSNELDVDALKLEKAKPDAFWSGEWGTERLNYLKSGDLYLLGAHAHVGPSGSPQPVRWVGALKKIEGKWQYTTLAWPGLYAPPGFPNSPPQAISLSLRDVLP